MRSFLSRYWWVVVAVGVFAAAALWLGISSTRHTPDSTQLNHTGATSSQPRSGGDGIPALSVSNSAPSAPTSSPKAGIIAHEYLVAPLEDGSAIIFTKNAGARWPLASITKLMTASIVLEHIAPDQQITTMEVPGAYTPSSNHIPVGSTYRADDLLRDMLVESSNEAAESFAAAYTDGNGSGRTAFIAAMNAQAAAWGLTNTHYDDPAGLSVGSQSTAQDLLKLVRHIHAAHPEVFETTRLPSVTVRDINGVPYTAIATNEFAGRAGFLGGKTGYTDEAQGNLVSLFLTRSVPTVYIVLGSANRFGDTDLLVKQVTAKK